MITVTYISLASERKEKYTKKEKTLIVSRGFSHTLSAVNPYVEISPVTESLTENASPPP